MSEIIREKEGSSMLASVWDTCGNVQSSCTKCMKGRLNVLLGLPTTIDLPTNTDVSRDNSGASVELVYIQAYQVNEVIYDI